MHTPLKRTVPFIALLATIALASPLRAEKEDISPERLRETATHVITGQVMAIYASDETAGDWKYTRYVAEIRVEQCEKGDGIKQGDLVYARYWQRAWIGKGQVPPSSSGHRKLPGKGESFRIYLARNAYDGFNTDNKDGGFNVIGANGFEKVKDGVILNVKGDGVTRLEANQTLIGFSSTKIFYTLSSQHAVVAIHIDNKDKKFAASGKVYQFTKGVTADDLGKWVNNQQSDALFPDIPEPVATHPLPKDSIKTVSSKLLGTEKGEPEGVTYDKYSVEFAASESKLNANLKVGTFKDSATVYIKPQEGK